MQRVNDKYKDHLVGQLTRKFYTLWLQIPSSTPLLFYHLTYQADVFKNQGLSVETNCSPLMQNKWLQFDHSQQILSLSPTYFKGRVAFFYLSFFADATKIER